MNRQFHNKRQSLTVTDKYTGIGKLFDWSKNFTGDMFNIKLEEKSNKMSFKALSVKIQRSKNRQGGGGAECARSPHPSSRADRVKYIRIFVVPFFGTVIGL